jgi:two-component system nitrogen regulation response regulator NtrX
MSNIYIVDDDRSVLQSLSSTLKTEGWEVETFIDPVSFLSKVKESAPSVAIIDIFFSDRECCGDELVLKVKEFSPVTECIIISGESDIQKSIACIKNGAVDFLEKPVSLTRLLITVRNAMAIHTVKTDASGRFRILGDTPSLAEMRSRIQKLAALNEGILICGENGTGKELVAENLHLFSSRSVHPLYKINCTALNPNIIESELFGHTAGSFTGADRDKQGCFERANKSTLLLDEIGDFSPHLQSKLLRVLQEKRVLPVGATKEVAIDVRMLFATNCDLEAAVRSGTFREDLYFRISTFVIRIPPLRERLQDIDVLAQHFLNEFLRENKLLPKAFAPSAIDRLKEYHYPGNIRELARIVKNAAFFTEGSVIKAEDIDLMPQLGHPDIWFRTRSMPLSQACDYFERELILRRLEQSKNDIAQAAGSLGMIKNNLYRKMKQCGIRPDTVSD